MRDEAVEGVADAFELDDENVAGFIRFAFDAARAGDGDDEADQAEDDQDADQRDLERRSTGCRTKA